MKKLLFVFSFFTILLINHSVYAKCGKVRIGDFDWDSANFHTALVSYILEKHYGCEVVRTKGSTNPILADLFRGQIDLLVEVWEYNNLNQINDEIKKGTILHLGINGISTQGFYIDRKTAYKYNLVTIDDMKNSNIAQLFDNKLISCISGWTCHAINYVKLKEYGLDSLYENYDPGSGGNLDYEIKSSFINNKPIFTYYWEPTSLLGNPSIDLIPLKEPNYNDTCWSNMMTVVNSIKSNGVSAYKPSCASGYKDLNLTKLVSKDFANNNKEIISFLESYNVSTKEVNEMLDYYVERSGGDMRMVAEYYFNRNNEKIIAWVSGTKSETQIADLESEEIKIAKLKNFLNKDIITEEEYNYKRNEILGLPNNETVVIKKVIVSKDTTAPVINIPNSFEADSNLLAEVKGFVSDDSEIVKITVDGDLINFSNGKFAQKLFVKPGGQKILITAMDKFGNESNKTILLKRSDIVIATNIFDDLNPTIVKTKINPSAVALIIGIEEYKYTFAAPFAKNDALAFNDFAHYSLGVPMQNIKLLTNDNAERTSTLKSVKWLSKIIKENSSDVYVFFSGHGLASEDGEDLYLLPSDGDPDLLEDSTLLRNQLFDRIAKLNPRSVTVFLDTCYSGATRTDEFLVAAKPIFIEAQEQDIPAKFTVFSASAGRETAKVLPEAQHGLFSYYMMKGLEGEADVNNDKQITNGELIAFVNKKVSRQANQTPQLNGDPEQVLLQW